MELRTALALALTLSALLIVVPSALAVDYCVGSTPNCPTQTQTPDAAGFQAALTASNGNSSDDRIFLKAGGYNLGAGIPFTVSGSQKLEIIGAGSDQTQFDCSLASLTTCFSLNAPVAGSKISGFTMNVQGSGSSSNTGGLGVARAQVSDVKIVDLGSMSAFTALYLNYSAVADGCAIRLASSNSKGVSTGNTDSTLRNCTISGGSGNHSTAVSMSGSGNTFNIDHCVFRDVETGVYSQSGTMNLSDVLIDLATHTYGLGLNSYNGAFPGSPTPAVLRASRLTIVGTGANQRGLWLGAVNANTANDVVINDSVVYSSGATFTAVTTQHANTAGAVTIALNRTALNLSQVSYIGADPFTPTYSGAINLATVAPGFANPAGGDCRPAAGSPLIDAGSNASTPLPGSTDVGGAPRIVDGNGDGVARVDVGAYEFQPTASTLLPSPATATAKIVAKPKKSFKVGRKGGFGIAKKGASSFSVLFTNSAKARFTLKSIGKKKKLKSVKGSQTISVKNATVKFGFRGKWNKKKLKAGRYRVTITPLAADGAAGKPVSVNIKLK